MSDLWRVRIRTRSREFSPTSADMTRAEADELIAAVERKAVDCGDGWRFFQFEQSGGSAVKVRGREVTAIEVIRPGRDRRPAAPLPPFRDETPERTRPAGPRPAVPAPEPAAAGTRFLQSLPQRHPQVQPVIRLSGDHR